VVVEKPLDEPKAKVKIVAARSASAVECPKSLGVLSGHRPPLQCGRFFNGCW